LPSAHEALICSLRRRERPLPLKLQQSISID
jgi:hypothetical protein